MLLVYVPNINNRVRYIFNLILKDLLGLTFTLTKDIDEFKNYNNPKFNYSEKPFGDELFIMAHPLLFQKGVKKQEVEVGEFESIKMLFPQGNESAIHFDIFAASFYLVARYEEYLPYIGDKYGRFQAEETIAYKNGFLNQPVINIWALKLKEILEYRYSSLDFSLPKYQFTPTIDVDSAFAYKSKGLIRTIGGYYKAISALDKENFIERTNVLFRNKKDPFDTFEYLFEIQKKYNLNPLYFLLVGDYDEYDKNVSLQTLSFQSLVKSIADNAEVGIHPSFASNSNLKKLKKETGRLSAVLKREIKLSRQHFLKVHLPGTYLNLLELEITDDFSMGFASQIGFRAGIASPFYFYNLDQEMITSLRVHPFSMMDATMQYYLKLNVAEAIDCIKQHIKNIKKVNGLFIPIWHNNSFVEEREWLGWKAVYEEMIKMAIDK